MIVESIADLIEQELLVGHNHDELVFLRAILHNAVLIFSFQQRESMFLMHLSSNHMFPNPERFASFLMILDPVLKWTRKNRPHVLWMSFTSSLFVVTFMVDWLSRSIHNGLSALPDPWVLFPLFRNDFHQYLQRCASQYL